MAKRTDLQRIMIIGSGPIVIGQAAEFDYAGTQACLALKEEGYEVILVNSNPATIMTDTTVADKVYMEPLTLEYVAKLSTFHSQFRAVGTNYNQVVKELHSHFSERRALSMLYKLEKQTMQLAAIGEQIVALSKEFQQRW